MEFEIIDSLSQTDRSYSVAVFGRRGEPQIKISVFPRSLSVFWKAALPHNALEDAWKQTRLSLIFAKCEPVIFREPAPAAKMVRTVQAIQQFVVDSTSRRLGASIAMKVEAENETTRPITLHLVAALRGSSTDEMGFDLNRKTVWEQPQIRQFILNMFRSTFVHGEVTQCEIDDLTTKISQMARPQKNRKAASAAVANGISD